REQFRPGWLQAAGVPNLLEIGLVVVFLKKVISYLAVGSDVLITVTGRQYLHAARGMQIECPGGGVQVVAAEVAERAAAQSPEIAPGYRDVFFVEGHKGRGPQPKVPSDIRSTQDWAFGDSLKSGIPALGGYPGMGFLHFSDCAVPQVFDRLADPFPAVKRVPHLGGQSRFLCHFAYLTGFPYVMGQGDRKSV